MISKGLLVVQLVQAPSHSTRSSWCHVGSRDAASCSASVLLTCCAIGCAVSVAILCCRVPLCCACVQVRFINSNVQGNHIK